MKEGSLFILYLWDPLNHHAFDCILALFWKLWKKRGATWAYWFTNVWTCNAKVLEYWMISSLKIKLSPSWKFQRNWNVPLVLLERSWWAGFNGIYLVRFGFRMWEILILKWYLPLKIIKKFPKNQVLEGKISWGHGNTWANGTSHTNNY